MGQKVKPRTYRLGVPCDKSTLLITPEMMIPTKDRMGHKIHVGFSKHEAEYGLQLNSARVLINHREERRRYMGVLSNRSQIHILTNLISIEREIYKPVGPLKKDSDSDNDKDSKVGEWIDRDRVQRGLDRICKMLETPLQSEIKLKVVNRNGRLNNEGCLSIVEKRCSNETKLRETFVSQEGRAGALVLNARKPSSERLSKVVARQLEDSRKHSDVRSQRRSMLRVMDESDRGRVDYASIISGKVANRNGGYRGYRIVTKGTIDGGRRTRKEVIANGVLPLSTITSPISYGYKQAKTKTGTRGVHVMYCY